MKTIKLFDFTGAFAENKDVAQNLRVQKIIPALQENTVVILDFENVESATQSFMHALISDLFRQHGKDILDRVRFKSCTETVQSIVSIVSDYMQESE